MMFLNTILEKVQNSQLYRVIFYLLSVFIVLEFWTCIRIDTKIENNQLILEKKLQLLINEKYHVLLSKIQQFENVQIRKKRSNFAKFDNIGSSKNDFKNANVEFFNPKLRPELEKRDGTIMSKNSADANVADDNWVWLTSYSRIPLIAIQGFCSATKDYCPPGERGLQGPPGDRGQKGEKGEQGLIGPIGPIGNRGPRGAQGAIGWPGAPGLDGRDGLPGEPGIDGVPGRNGIDGIPGIDGTPGKNGEKGIDGMNGTDGKPGEIGPRGPEGPPGPKGLTGPRGRSGKPGLNGTPGTPGITAYQVNVNGSNSKDLLIPPSIVGSKMTLYKPIIIDEGDNLRLRCIASGVPKPIIEWRKIDNSLIPLGAWKTLSVNDNTLNITQINRVHMGTYQCIADNGIPPKRNQTFHVEVHFAPMIKIYKQMIGAVLGKFIILECDVEAFPTPVIFWERGNGLLIENDDKYFTDVIEKHTYGFKMILNITKIEHDDYTAYHCICKNAKGLTKASFTIYEIDSRLLLPHSTKFETHSNVFVYGLQPPEYVSMEDICPPQITCPECPNTKDLRCENGISLFDLVGKLEIRPFNNVSFIGLSNRTSECMLYAVGKAVYHRYTNETFGSWMRDLYTKTYDFSKNQIHRKYWTTSENNSYQLLEFANKSTFFRNIPLKHYNLEHAFRGNAHIIYNESFYYQDKYKPRILKYDLSTGQYRSLYTPLLETKKYLYTTSYNQMDFNADDNGLWVIYGLNNTNNTIVMKIEAHTMQIEFMWNISINHHKVGEMFIVCGVLYGVDSVTEGKTKIRLALDLYSYKLLDFSPLEFTNPFHKTTMITYNHYNKELMTWDKGNQLTYPVRYNEIDHHYNVTVEDHLEYNYGSNNSLKTGYEIGAN